ncbi:Protein of unknown function, partial [Gryllus bimaculatus]
LVKLKNISKYFLAKLIRIQTSLVSTYICSLGDREFGNIALKALYVLHKVRAICHGSDEFFRRRYKTVKNHVKSAPTNKLSEV